MTQPQGASERDDRRDLARVTQEIAGRLRDRGVAVFDGDSPEDLVRLLDAVEDFERAVSARGGDLMMDEPRPNEPPQPDDPAFLLPFRPADEPAPRYISRLSAVTAQVRQHRPLP